MRPRSHILDVYGDFACFARPEMKVERFSYPVITPSAARGIFDAIYCKPLEFRWQVTRVDVLSEPNYIALRRNETKDKGPSENTVLRWMDGREVPEPIFADATKEDTGSDFQGRTQRQTMALRNVHYRLYGEIRPWPAHLGKQPALDAQFERRASQGKCVWQPYFGCREFPAFFELISPESPSLANPSINMDLGLMLYDVFDLSTPAPAGPYTGKPSVSLFRATIEQGVLRIPPYESPAVVKGLERSL